MPDFWPYFAFFGLVTATGIWLLIHGVQGLTRKHPATPLLAGETPGEERPEQVTALPSFVQRRWARPVSLLGQRLYGQRDAARLEDRLRRSGWRYGSVGDYYGSKI